MDLKSKIILIYGPTSSGKSEFAIKLARKVKGEIINADSMQIYKDLRILTARPLKEDLKKIKHHLYGFQDSKKDFSVGDWLKIAIKKIEEIRKRKKIPILVGGTGLYFKALTDGLVEIKSIPKRFRNKIRLLQKNIGQEKFYKKLLEIDPITIDYIRSNDVQRSIRAYEVKQFTKKSIIHWYKGTKPNFKKKDFIKLYIDYPRSDLIDKINQRVVKMMNMGVVLEVKRFLKLRISKNKSISKAIGIDEIKDFITKKELLDVVIEKISIKTRQYAKRQVTWARGHMKSWKKIDPKRINIFIKKI
ncbi:tRNA (adenosine(37)-N6)-dimethylallyltransferase MiaA [Candidatus Pelagibacter sp.]|nr:tRNA (adenosine(37)-N6)-dimethylallyltransferase MiaA [Candidatus Pelagibacter sp.]